ncbi:MAG: ribosome small subunit-dependent GTPase A [Salinivirgaceae bacterium]|nr:ribosome small subunit-dependent GTPase A [Salinivirgaceae bacterium]
MEKGLVIKSTGSWYLVKTERGIVECRIRGKLRTKGLRTTNPIAVGDHVLFELEDNGNGLISSIEERKNYIIRKSTNLSKQAHILAANLDLAVIVVTLTSPRTYQQFIDRFLVTAEAYRIPVLIVFNKIDLFDEDLKMELWYMMDMYKKIGYQCIAVSIKNQQNTEELRQLLKGKISLVAGHSGVGKSSLLNLLNPQLNVKTAAVSESHDSGMHTTTFPEMHQIDNETWVIDSPGIKGFGVLEVDKSELYHYFPEIFAISADCQFNNCTHTHEPKCAVKQAVDNGQINPFRYDSYLNILNDEDEEKYRQGDSDY